MGITVFRDRCGIPDLLGRLEGESERDAVFTYQRSYLDRALENRELGVSERMPLDYEPYDSSECRAFFQGLLPEGETLANLSWLFQTPRNNYPALLAHLGCESIGALTFVADGVDRDEYSPRYIPISQDDVAGFATNPARAVLRESSVTRLSLAGAQAKVAWALPYGEAAHDMATARWLIPYGTAPSTHIVKISRRGEEDIAYNEWGCSVLARSCGMDASKVFILPEIPGAIAVERYDRLWCDVEGEKKVVRLHQEDFCQALGVSGYLKYKPTGMDVDYLTVIARLLDETSADPAADKAEFAKRTAFNYAIGNSDNHLKNSSLLYNEEWTARRLSPLYDVTCIPLTAYSSAMAFDIGDHRELDEITEADIAVIPDKLGVDANRFAQGISEIVDGLTDGDGADVESNSNSDALDVIGRVIDNSIARIKVLESFLGK